MQTMGNCDVKVGGSRVMPDISYVHSRT